MVPSPRDGIIGRGRTVLKLKRVEIQGFKSFFDRTEMKFHGSGIAAIVGPNGCGKSNLSDAISWVLGEQSAKSLRGARMEDVIFAGTRDRKPLGMASVSMVLVDPTGEHGHHPDETNGNGNGNGHVVHKPSDVTITRRLFRSGESEYLIDGKLARLRDIQDLFIGTGLGPESYAIIEQGRIGQILSNKPQDRRAIIEEAAGIGKFKTKKRLAEAKLEGAKQNLARVFDILEEVGRQVNSLKRQASKARRYEELRTEMVAQLRRSLTGRYRMLEREAAKTALDLNLANTEYQNLSNQVTEQEKAHTELQTACYRTEAELREARQKLADLQLEQERTRGKLDYQAKQIGAIEDRLTQGESEAQELEKRQAQFQQELEVHLASVATLEAQTESARERLAAKSEQREQIQQRLQQRIQTLETGRQTVLRLLGEASALKNQLVQIAEFLSAIERDTLRCQKEEQTATSDMERLESVKADLSTKMSARQMELESTTDRKRAVEEELNARKTKAAESRRALDQLRTDASRLKARKDSLEEILSHRAYTTESVKRLFTAIERGEAEGFQASGVLADFVDVDPAFEKATEDFLHEELEYVVVQNWNEAERGIDIMRTDLDGRATFLVHPEPDESLSARDELVNEEGVNGRLSDYVRFTNGFSFVPPHLLHRLGRCYVCNDRAVAQKLAVRYPECFFLLPDGVSYHGHALSGGKKTGSGPLALKRELRELTGEVAIKHKAVEETAALVEQLDREIATFSEDLESLRALQQSQEKDALALDHEHRKLAEEYARASSRLSVARLELERLRQEGDRARAQQERDQQLLEEKEAARSVEEQVLEQSRADLEELQSEAHQLVEEHGALRAELAGFEERRRSERATQARYEGQIAEISARREEIRSEMERLGIERARLLSDNIELDRRAGELVEELRSVEETVARLAGEETTQRENLTALEEALKQLRIDVQTAQEKRSQVELELVKKQGELKYLDETSRRELNAPLEELSAGEEAVLDEAGLAEAEQRYQEVKARIEALGPVNPQALEEFQEAQQRYDFLNAQRQDLLDSIRDTEKAIYDIDVESRKRFSDAFEAINVHFRDMFRTLFGGGVGEMRLTDESNIAESGIDIVASPPGKRLQNVLLLSGGEKSLTAMALLMAIFLYQPSPFCILDEVDAPLDEPNIERLTRLLKDMAGQTQFIVITHAKRTMEAAQSLYGVTMQEPGVSKLVSVKFGDTTPPPRPTEQLALHGAA
ncbi:MAG TPA: chromosome segregation protein SMC [Bryobacteraceae bacterium]|nr:chromosome segregation protein SMC [Bryobacteraceae bacterium]